MGRAQLLLLVVLVLVATLTLVSSITAGVVILTPTSGGSITTSSGTLHQGIGCGTQNGVQACSGAVVAKLNATECYHVDGKYLGTPFNSLSLRSGKNNDTSVWGLAFYHDDCTADKAVGVIGPCKPNQCCMGLWQLGNTFIGCFMARN